MFIESEHPRDEEGKFTYKNGGVSSQNREDILYPTMKNETEKGAITGGAAKIVRDEIAGVIKGTPMTIDEAINGVNPHYEIFGNTTYKTNCQASVAILEARMRGYDIEVNIALGSDLKDKLSDRPNIAYIDPSTGKTPEFTKLKSKNEFDCINYLDETVQKGERYIFTFQWKQKGVDGLKKAHIITVTKDSNNQLKFYDPQIGRDRDANFLSSIKYKFDWSEEPFPPMILRVDDKELNSDILNQISKPTEKIN